MKIQYAQTVPAHESSTRRSPRFVRTAANARRDSASRSRTEVGTGAPIVSRFCFCGREREDFSAALRLETGKSPDPATKGGAVEEQDLTTSEDEVEGHMVSERPSSESPTAERTAEGVAEEPDVEGHAMAERPSAERPSAE